MSSQNEVLTEHKFSNGNILVLRMISINTNCYFFVYLKSKGFENLINFGNLKSFRGINEWDNAYEYYHLLKDK